MCCPRSYAIIKIIYKTKQQHKSSGDSNRSIFSHLSFLFNFAKRVYMLYIIKIDLYNLIFTLGGERRKLLSVKSW